MSILRDVQKPKKRGRKSIAETYRGPRFYTGCGRMVRVKDGEVVPCGCRSCVEGGW
jgi:hypothetical protein